MFRKRAFQIALSIAITLGAVAAQTVDKRTPEQRLAGFDLAGLKALNHGDADKGAIADLFVPDQHLLAFVYYALPAATVRGAFKDFLKTIAAARVDQQLGANPGSGASSSTVAKTGLTSLVSFALESGALTQTVDQNVTTLHANGDGLYRFLTNQEVVPTCLSSDASCQAGWAKNLDLSASFNVSGSGTKTLTGQTTAAAPVDLSAALTNHQFSSATVQYALTNKRDLRSKQYHDSFKKWFAANQAALHAAGRALIISAGGFLNAIDKADNAAGDSSPYSRWKVETLGLIATDLQSNPANFTATLDSQYAKLITLMRAADPQFDTKLNGVFQAYVTYFSSQDQLGRNMITTPEFMIQATYSEPPLQPKLINAKFSFAHSPGSSDPSKCGNAPAKTKPGAARVVPADGFAVPTVPPALRAPISSPGSPATAPAPASPTTSDTQSCANPGTLTVNFGIDLYQAAQPTGFATNTSRFRDAQAALQFDRPLGSSTSPAQLSIGAYYQYQRNPGIFMVPTGATMVPNTEIPLPPNGATVLTNTKGSLYVIQAMVTIQIPSAGLKMPVGISFSNKTDLLPGNEVRGHIGFTFNSEAPLLSAKPSQ